MDHQGVRALSADQEAWPRLHGGGTLAHPEETWRSAPSPQIKVERTTANGALTVALSISSRARCMVPCMEPGSVRNFSVSGTGASL